MPVNNRYFQDAAGHVLFSADNLALVGAVVPIEIHVPQVIAQVLTGRGHPHPAVTGMAMVDTGATFTCVHEPVLLQLGLNPVGVATSGTASGPVQQSQYPVRLVSPDQNWTFDLITTGVNLSGQPFRSSRPRTSLRYSDGTCSAIASSYGMGPRVCGRSHFSPC